MKPEDLTPEQLADIERRFENFDYTKGTVYEAGDPHMPADILITQALAARMFHEAQDRKPTRCHR